MDEVRLLVISPCRDEALHVRRTLESVCAQTVLPTLWVIVDDGSTDGTRAILDEYAARHPWLRVVERGDRGERAVGPGVVEAFYAGLETVERGDYDFLCKLDVDLDLPPRYFEVLLERMRADPRLGTASGKPWFRDGDGRRVTEPCGDEMSVGMTKLYRRQCFEEIGGLERAVMWDGIDCHRARMLGWKAASFDAPELWFEHLRPMGSSQQSVWVGRKRHGAGQHFMGTGLVYLAASAVSRIAHPPAVKGSLGLVAGWLERARSGAPRYGDAAFRRFLRRYQREALLLGKRRATERAEARGRALRARRVGAGALPEVELCGVRLHALSEAGCIDHVVTSLAAGRGGWIVTPNLDHLRRLVHDPEYASLCADADLRVADGMPLVWASRLQRTPLPERVAGSHLVSSLTAAAAGAGRSIYLLGGDEGTAEGAAAVLRARHPELVVAGTDCPQPGFERDEEALRGLRERLVAAAPDVVYVALGSPKQERLIRDLHQDLPRAWCIGVGISFSFLTGDVRRAPRWMQRLGLEWVHRLVQEPRRLARRYLALGLPFAARLLVGSAWRGLTRGGSTPPPAPRGDPSGTGAR